MSDPSSKRYPRIALDVPPEESDVVVAEVFSLGATGVEERDQSTLERSAGQGLVTLLASFDSDEAAGAALALFSGRYDARSDDVVGEEWRDAWKQHFRPFHLTAGVVICPPWDTCPANVQERLLVLEPGRAFGTGLHATTALVAQSIEMHKGEFENREILDVGCGTGILALIALLLGAKSARAMDNDCDAIAVAIENAERNHLSSRLIADTSPLPTIVERFPFIVANIQADVLIRMACELIGHLEPGGLLVLSGILQDQVEGVAQSFSSLALEHVGRADEWAVLELRKAT